MATAYEADNKINKKFPGNIFPQFVRGQVDLHKLVQLHAIDKGGSIISNREWVYNHCMDVINRLE